MGHSVVLFPLTLCEVLEAGWRKRLLLMVCVASLDACWMGDFTALCLKKTAMDMLHH